MNKLLYGCVPKQIPNTESEMNKYMKRLHTQKSIFLEPDGTDQVAMESQLQTAT